MFEFRARILQASPTSFLRLVDGFPQIFTESPTVSAAEIDVGNAMGDYLASLAKPPQARVEQDDFPTVRMTRIALVAYSTSSRFAPRPPQTLRSGSGRL
jgi:hypothetical protein